MDIETAVQHAYNEISAQKINPLPAPSILRALYEAGQREGLEKAAMYNEGFRAGLEEAATVLDDLGAHRTDSDGHALIRADQIQARIRRLKG